MCRPRVHHKFLNRFELLLKKRDSTANEVFALWDKIEECLIKDKSRSDTWRLCCQELDHVSLEFFQEAWDYYTQWR